MAVKMRLRREGKKKQPYYRVVVADVRSPRDGRFIEDIGYYQPLSDPSGISIDRERALYWLSNGVKPSDAVLQLLRIEGIWEEFKPGDTGKDRSAKHAKKAAAKAAREQAEKAAAAEQAEKAAAAEQAEKAAAAEQAETEQAAATETAPEVVEQDAQPSPGPTEETGAIAEETDREET